MSRSEAPEQPNGRRQDHEGHCGTEDHEGNVAVRTYIDGQLNRVRVGMSVRGEELHIEAQPTAGDSVKLDVDGLPTLGGDADGVVRCFGTQSQWVDRLNAEADIDGLVQLVPDRDW